MLSNRGLSTLFLSFLLLLSLSILNPALSQTCTDADGDGWGVNGDASCPGTGEDCDDTDPTVHPGAQKICDGKDNNCDGKKDFTTDEDKDLDGVPWCLGDCDDNNPNRAPNILEAPMGSPVCLDGIDNDCDNRADSADQGCQFSCFDSDGDGYGINGDASCDFPGEIDCNDNDDTVNPGVTDDSCNGIDNNCSTVIDDEYVIDALCGVGECLANNTVSSCVDGVETLCIPGSPAPEGVVGSPSCTDGVDNDCDGLSDTDPACQVSCQDFDEDGYGTTVDVSCQFAGIDCDDSNALINPGGDDANCNGIDEDCVGGADSGYVIDAGCGTGECQTNNIPGSCTGGVETACQPGAPVAEDTPGVGVCTDGVDNDCDGLTDTADSEGCSSLDVDDDGDGYTENQNDCNDGDPTMYPGAPKICDGKDNNCDGKRDFTTDEDKDLDGVPWCAQDCDDNNPDRAPNLFEGGFGSAVCTDGIDNDCDNRIDFADLPCQGDCIDTDGDGYGINGDTSCDIPGEVDCDDTSAAVNPAGDDANCNGIDEDCVGGADSGYVSDTLCGTGECQANNTPSTCAGGVETACQPGAPVLEGPQGDPTCSGGLDEDCDDLVDGDDPGCNTLCIDQDGDGYGSNGHASCPNGPAVDCDDSNAAAYPGGDDANCNGIDEDCVGGADSGYVVDTSCGTGLCNTTNTPSSCTGGVETLCQEGTPGEENVTIAGTCTDGVDNDCDGSTDAVDSDCSTAEIDNDGDGYCRATACTDGSSPNDCDDTDPNVYPGAAKICDGKDSNCDGKKDSPTDEDKDLDGVPWCAGDCDDNNPLAYPGNTEGPWPDPTCTDGIDNDCDGTTDCPPPTCATKTSPRNGPHSETMMAPGPDGLPNTGDDITHPENNDLLCGKCHGVNLQDPVRSECARCHTAGGASKAAYPDPWPFGFGSAPDVQMHSSTVLGTKYGAWDMDCMTCHNPHSQEQDGAYGTSYGKYIKEYICLNNPVTGLNIEEIVEFTAASDSGSFADGPPYNENICNMCHTQTNHHRRDDAPPAPGGQDHNNGQECTTCHPHIDGFAPTGGEPAAPHDTGRFLTECDLCHVTPTDFSSTIPDSKCEQCHAPSGIEKTNFPAAPDVLTHADFNGSGNYVYNIACVDCHNPMFDQPNLKLIRPVIQNSVLGGTIMFTSFSGAGSFADGSPYINNICNTCHSQTNHHQADGTAPGGQDHNNSLDCGTCHAHDNAFLPGAAGQSHDTHLNSIKGPQLSCDTGCHGTNSPPLFADANDLANTAICDNCHSPGGSFDGVNDPVTGAKANWSDGVYDGRTLAIGKEFWCAGCHDDVPSNSMIDGTGVSARNVIGDGTTYGFYVTGHGNEPSINCLHCHSPSRQHIDHEYRDFKTVMDYIPNPTNYRFYDQKGMELPYDQGRQYSDFALCYSCHDSTWLQEITGDPETWQTNFRQTDTNDSLYEKNLHYYHVYYSITPKKTCVFCHDPHGTENPRMTVASRMGTFKNLRYDVVTGKYFELTDPGLWNTIENRGGAITTPQDCSACHGTAVADLVAGADPNDQYKAGWYLRTYNPKTYFVLFDIDSDGITDDVDNCPVLSNSGQTDIDLDGIGDACDNCQDTANNDQTDSDLDNIGDICDMCAYDANNDIDSDGLCADIDPCPDNPSNPDADNDFICDDVDNCPDNANFDQADLDEDGIGDTCDQTCFINGALIKWVGQYGSYITDDNPNGFDYAAGVSVDVYGNVHITGATQGEIPGNTYNYSPFSFQDAHVARYDEYGNNEWIREFGTSDSEKGNDVVSDASGNIYVIGNAGGDIFIAKYDTGGNQLWLNQYGIAGRSDKGNRAAIYNNNIFIVGTSSLGNATNNDLILIKTSLEGTQQWIHQISSPGIFDDTGEGISFDGSGNFYITGHTRGVFDGTNNGVTDVYIAKYDSDGNQIWIKQFGSSSSDGGSDIAVDVNSSAVYVTGSTYGNLDGINQGFYDGFLAKYDPNGNQLWVKQFGTSTYDYSNGVVTDPAGNIYITGYTYGTIGAQNLGGYDIYISKYSQNGIIEWASQLGTNSTDHASSIVIDDNGYVYVTGDTGGNFGSQSMGSMDAYVFKASAYCP